MIEKSVGLMILLGSLSQTIFLPQETAQSVQPPLHLSHEWLLTSQDPERLQRALQDQAAKLPEEAFYARLKYAQPDGLLRVIVALSQRDPLVEFFVQQSVPHLYWLGLDPRFIAAVTSDQLAALLELPFVSYVEPDVPVYFFSAESSWRTQARSKTGNGTGVWSYNATLNELESDLDAVAGPITGKGVTVAMIDSGIDRTHSDFFDWECASTPKEVDRVGEPLTEPAGLHGPVCSSRIKAAVKISPLAHSPTRLVGVSVDAHEGDYLATTDHALGHGTHTAGIIAGNGFAARTISESRQDVRGAEDGDGYVFGMAPETDLVSVSIGDTDNLWMGASVSGTSHAWKSLATAALQWTLDHVDEYGIRVLFNGWGCGTPSPSATLTSSNECGGTNDQTVAFNVLRELYRAGVVVVFPTGNNQLKNTGGLTTFLSDLSTIPYVLGVAAYNDLSNQLAPFSSHGSDGTLINPTSWDPEKNETTVASWEKRPDLAAPGVGIFAARNLIGTAALIPASGNNAPTASEHPPRTDAARSYAALSGTSMAAAHVAGAAALLIDACPSATPLDVMRALLVGAKPLSSGTPASRGYGAVDVRGSLNWLLRLLVCETSVPPRVASLTTSDGPVFTGFGTSFSATAEDRDGTIVEWEWDFGDGNTSNAAAPGHTYSRPGKYNVSLVVTDNDGARAFRQTFLHVVQLPASLKRLPPLEINSTTAAELSSRGDGSVENPYVIENLEILIDPATMGPPPAAHLEAQAPFGSVPSVRNIGLLIKDLGTKHLLLRNIFVRPNESNPAPTVAPMVGVKVDSSAARMQVENLVICGTSQRRFANGLLLSSSEGNKFLELSICNSDQGITVGLLGSRPKNNLIRDCRLWSNSDAGLVLSENTDNNVVQGCWIYRNKVGIRVEATAVPNKIFDNAFVDNSVRGEFTGASAARDKNKWYDQDPPAPGRNILGGAKIGGNYWSDYVGQDQNGDGFGDSSLDVTGKAQSNENGKDKFPLVLGKSPPQVDFSLSELIPRVDEPVTFTAHTTDQDGIPIYWFWDFGDGVYLNTTNSFLAIQHVYKAAGSYRVRLTVVDNDGKAATNEALVVVNAAPVSDFRILVLPGGTIQADARCPLSPCAYDPDATDNASLKLAWSFEMEGVSGRYLQGTPGSPAVQYRFAESGDALISLEASDNRGGTATKVQLIEGLIVESFAPPMVDFEATAGTTSTPVIFTDRSFDSNGPLGAWIWGFGDSTCVTALNPLISPDIRAILLSVLPSPSPCPATASSGPLGQCNPQTPPRTAWYLDPQERLRVEHCYTEDKTYPVQVRVFDTDYDQDAAVVPRDSENLVPVLVAIQNSLPIAQFRFEVENPDSGDPDEIRTVDTILFTSLATDSDGPLASWAWDFDGDGDIDSSQQDPSHSYLEDGDYLVRLTVTDNDGETSSITQLLSIHNTPPLVEFDWTPSNPLTRDVIEFESDETRDRDFGSIDPYSWYWDFGDGSNSTDPKPTKKYSSDGLYHVTLRVADNDGGTVSKTKLVVVGNTPPAVSFDYLPLRPTIIDEIQFEDRSSDIDGDIQNRLWKFGDGNTSTEQRPRHKYERKGSYQVELVATDDDGATTVFHRQIRILSVPPRALFAWALQNGSQTRPTTADAIYFQDASSDHDGNIVLWQWDFGDGSGYTIPTPGAPPPSKGSPPPHRFRNAGDYKVTLTVTDNDNRNSTFSTRIRIENQLPVGHFTYSPERPTVGKPIQFHSTLVDPDGSVLTYSWDFGDGATANLRSPSHVYVHKGTYVVTLAAIDDQGGQFTSSRAIRLDNLLPQTSFDYTPAAPTTSEPIRFVGASQDQDGTIVKWEWDFGDGSRSTLHEPTHAFARKGTYNVSLASTDDDGGVGRAYRMVSVTDVPPRFYIDYNPLLPTSLDDVQFRIQLQSDFSNSISWNWNFGDGNVSTDRNPQHRFAKAGAYSITVSAMEEGMVVASSSRTITLSNVAPQAAFAFDRNSSSIRFTDLSKDLDGRVASRIWDFGDGSVSTETSPTHSYPAEGGYLVSLTVLDDEGVRSFAVEVVPVSAGSPSALEKMEPQDPSNIPWLDSVALIAGLVAVALARRSDRKGSV